jgi:hypothetical protein
MKQYHCVELRFVLIFCNYSSSGSACDIAAADCRASGCLGVNGLHASFIRNKFNNIWRQTYDGKK